MSEEKKYRTWTSADIEKYHKGLLSPKEMNEMERAALDDPFLSDALEGYGNVTVNLSADIAELEKKLEQRVDAGKVVKMPLPSSFYKVLRVAAVVILLAGGALLIYQLGFNNSKKSLAREDNKQVKQPQQHEQADSQKTFNPVTVDSVKLSGSLKTESGAYTWQANGNKKGTDSISVTSAAGLSNFATILSDSTSTSYNYTLNAASPNLPSDKAKSKTEGFILKNKDDVIPLYKGSTVPQDRNLSEVTIKTDTVGRSYRKEAANMVGVVSNDNLYLKAKAQAVSNNYFNGRIVDNNNNAVPFANVTNIRDNVGTYADANGFFTLISPDTSLNLRIKSVGFQSDTVKFLENAAAVNQVTLKEDKMTGVVLGGKRIGNNPKPDANIKIEEPEPADGWSNYSLYLANNLKVPDEVKRKDARGEVQVSFEVNKLGEPVNIKVEKSLCKECDEEAKRLIQQGPKWKPNKKKKRVTVNVSFEANE